MKEIYMTLQYDTLRKLLMLPEQLKITMGSNYEDELVLVLTSDEFTEEFLSGAEGNVYAYTPPAPIDGNTRDEILAFIKSMGIETISQLQGLITQ